MPKTEKKAPKKALRQSTLLDAVSSPVRASPAKKHKKKKDSDPQPTIQRKRRKPFLQPQAEESDSDVGAIKFESAATNSDAERPSPMKRRKVIVIPSDDEEDTGLVFRRFKKRDELSSTISKGKTRAAIALDSEDDDVSVTRKKLRLHKGPRKAVSKEESDSDSLATDTERVIEARFRDRNRMTAFQKNLERLKRRKQGKPEESSEQEDYSQVSGSESHDTPFQGARNDDGDSEDHDSLFDEKEDSEADFIINDDGDGVALLPVEFRAQQDLVHDFKTIFQLFVHLACHASNERRAFMEKQMKDNYFSVPLHTARRKIIGLRDSLVASSVWRPEFRRSLEALPKFDLYKLDFSVPACDACHLGGRISTLRGQLEGAPYNLLGFDEIVSDPESNESDDDSIQRKKKKKKKKSKQKEPKNEQKKQKQPQYIDELHLGRFCARRTRVYHDLSHWEYHLFKTIEIEVDELHSAKNEDGYVRVAWAGGRKPPEDLGDADSICEWLDERHFIETEWQKLKKMMDSATQLEASAKKENDMD